MATQKKIIVTSKKNLKSKYANRFPEVEALLAELIASDLTRDLETLLVYIDDATSAGNAGITEATAIGPKSCKKAVDDLYMEHLPAYIMIFGSKDIFPFQELENPAYDGAADDDSKIPSDLPYACDAKYGTDISKFTGPGRVVGRLPDITGTADLNHLKTMIRAIINTKPKEEDKYKNYFSISAEVWKKSTRKSLTKLFGDDEKMLLAPPARPGYNSEDLSPLTHFFNCHGLQSYPYYNGGNAIGGPKAVFSGDLVGKVKHGTVVAAECCFGIELYDPTQVDEFGEIPVRISIADTYLGNKAIAFVGSSNLSYGSRTEPENADVITMIFIAKILAGASTGRAMLEARQRFLHDSTPLNAQEMKTVAQFTLLGDPSLHPVKQAPDTDGREFVENRRLRLMQQGNDLTKRVETSRKLERPTRSKKKEIQKEMKEIFRKTKFTGEEPESLHEVISKKNASSLTRDGVAGKGPIRFRTFTKKQKRKGKGRQPFKALVIKETGEKILGWKVYHSK